MTKGLVSKSRTEKQNAMSGLYSKQREETKQQLFGGTKKKICSNCGTETAGIYKDGKLRCHICEKTL